MENFSTVEQILNFAIEREVEAHDFYQQLADQVKNPAMQKVLREFAIEELGHKLKLEAVKASEIQLNQQQTATLGIAEQAIELEPSQDMNYADMLLLAMKREKAFYRLYLNLSAAAEVEDLRDMFLALAQEEAKHKLRLEIEYDDLVLKEG